MTVNRLEMEGIDYEHVLWHRGCYTSSQSRNGSNQSI